VAKRQKFSQYGNYVTNHFSVLGNYLAISASHPSGAPHEILVYDRSSYTDDQTINTLGSFKVASGQLTNKFQL